MREIFVSVDVESDGPIPSDNSMLSIGAAAFLPPSSTPISQFHVTLVELPGAHPDPQTTMWWKRQPLSAYQHARRDPIPPKDALVQFERWLRSFGSSPVFVGWPATWDYMWVHWYFVHFMGKSPFGIGGLDIKTLAWAYRNVAGASISVAVPEFKEVTKSNLPKEWFEGAPHTHRADEDAVQQGIMFISALNALRTAASGRRETR